MSPLRARGACAIGCALTLLAAAVQAQTAPTAQPAEKTEREPALSVVPRAGVTLTATDNNRSSGSGEADLITRLSAGVQVRKTAGRVQGALDYTLSGLLYARDADESNFQNELNAFGTAEFVDNWVYLDASANVSRQLISAFGSQSSDSSLDNSNQAEVATYSLSPYVRGRLGSLADYEARLSHAATRTDASGSSDSTINGGSLLLRGGNPLTLFSWSVTGSRTSYDFSEGRRTEEDRVRGVLTLALNSQLSVSAIGGREANNFTDLDKQSRSTSGFGISWRPTARTRFTAEGERRFFGTAHAASFEHRTPRSAIRFSSSRNVGSGLQRLASRSLGTAFDLFFLQFASVEPDPVAREQIVNDFLQANGISPTAVIASDFLASAVTVDRRQELSYTLLGVRDTITLLASVTDRRRLDTVAVVDDDFNNSRDIKQRGYDIGWARRLTPRSTFNLGLSQSKTTGDLSALATDLRTLRASWSSRLDKKTTVSLGARHSKFDSESNPYTENAVVGTLSTTF
ncbi:MAG: TIGR03016 family PEP-CTERM system-associated outer membrane protein [Pseudomonadota bacterium]